MPVQFRCNCGKLLRVRDELVGKRVKCPGSSRRGGGGPAPSAPPAGRDEWFIATWLLLAPIALEANQSGADALGKEQLPGEATLRPRAGDTVRVGDTQLVWKEYRARDY